MRMLSLLLWVGWNTLLAVAPVMLGYYIYDLAASPTVRRLSVPRKLWISVVGMVWLFFLPNTCYLLTEWRHFLETLGYSSLAYRWNSDSGAFLQLMVHTLFYMAYSGIGLLTFALAIRPIARLFRDSGAVMWVWAIPLFVLNSVGVYLGLVLRFNSWDMLTRLDAVWSSVVMITYRPVLMSFILAFAGFLWVAYVVMDIWVDGFAARWRQVKAKSTVISKQ